MSNIAITHACNKECSYCFASIERKNIMNKKDRKESDLHMSTSEFLNILNKHSSEERQHIKILGGEPTIHPNFCEFIDICCERSIDLTIITNLLFGEKVKSNLENHIINDTNEISFLVNCSELDLYKRMNKFEKNYRFLYELKKKNKNNKII